MIVRTRLAQASFGICMDVVVDGRIERSSATLEFGPAWAAYSGGDQLEIHRRRDRKRCLIGVALSRKKCTAAPPGDGSNGADQDGVTNERRGTNSGPKAQLIDPQKDECK